MVSMEDQQLIQCFYMQWIDLILYHRRFEHHVEEIFTITIFIGGIEELLSLHMSIGECCNSSDLRDQSRYCEVNLKFRIDIIHLWIECR